MQPKTINSRSALLQVDGRVEEQPSEGSLREEICINHDDASSVQVIPAGFSDKSTLLPASKCDSWLSELWFKLFNEEHAG